MRHCVTTKDEGTLECGCPGGLEPSGWVKMSTVLASCTVAIRRPELSKFIADLMQVEKVLLEREA